MPMLMNTNVNEYKMKESFITVTVHG